MQERLSSGDALDLRAYGQLVLRAGRSLHVLCTANVDSVAARLASLAATFAGPALLLGRNDSGREAGKGQSKLRRRPHSLLQPPRQTASPA